MKSIFNKTNIILLGIILLISILSNYHIENFNLPSIGTRYLCPTRNQSMDLRQDIPVKRQNWLYMNSSIGPEHPDMCRNLSLLV